jgi:probable HAF family extracellular repeat protein
MVGTRTLAVVLLASWYLLGCTTPPAAADFLYSVQNLGVPPGDTSADGFGLNDRGQVAGYVNSHAGFYDGVSFRDLGGFRVDANSVALGINYGGLIVGNAITKLGDQQAFVYSTGTGFKDLGTLGGPNSSANSINDKGQIVGYSYTTSPAVFHAFLYQNGVIKDLGTLGGQISFATAINASGEITGNSTNAEGKRHAFLYVHNKLIDLGFPTIPANTKAGESSGTALNEKGTVVGVYSYLDLKSPGDVSHDILRAFRYDGVRFIDLGTLGGGNAQAHGINKAGDIVGSSDLPGDVNEHAFLFRQGHIYDLNDLIPAGTGFTLKDASAINQAGQILVNGTDAQGNNRAFLLTPDSKNTPEPSSLLLVILGSLGMLGIARRRRQAQKKLRGIALP